MNVTTETRTFAIPLGTRFTTIIPMDNTAMTDGPTIAGAVVVVIVVIGGTLDRAVC